MADFQICISAPLKFHGSTKKGNIKISQRKYLFDIKDDSRKIPCGKIPTRKIPTNQTPSLKNSPGKSRIPIACARCYIYHFVVLSRKLDFFILQRSRMWTKISF